jgi:WD40 repeat protein
MKRLAALLAFTSVLAACGSTVEATAPKTQAQGPVFLARTAGPTGPVTGYDAAGLGRRFELPGGIHAADGRSYYAVKNGKLLRFSTLTGRVTRTYALRGDWQLSGVSSTGDWVALQQPGTRILVVDAKRGKTVRDLRLSGNFRVETVSTAGDFLFLQQNFVDGSYAVRGYDLAAGQMLPGSLGTKGETIQMEGLASQVVASPDGRWLLTLYVNTETNTAFVHALNLIERIAICINMPPCTKCAPEALKRWGLALSPDGRTLFAANPSLGRVATIYLPTSRVVADSRFSPQAGGETRTAISPDGSQFVFTNGDTLWSFDTNVNWARTVPTGAGSIADLGFAADSGKLFLVGKDARLAALEL